MIAEDTEDGADDATVDADLEPKSEEKMEETTAKDDEPASLSEELAAKISREKAAEAASRESKEKERREEKERAAAGDALAALADACGEAVAAKTKEQAMEVDEKAIKQEDLDADGQDAGEQAGGLFLICEENVLPESPVAHNHGQGDHGDLQDGPGPAEGVGMLGVGAGAGRLGEMPSACCVTEVTPPTTPDDSQSSGNSHQSNNHGNASANNSSTAGNSVGAGVGGRGALTGEAGGSGAPGGGQAGVNAERRNASAAGMSNTAAPDKAEGKQADQRPPGAVNADEESTMSADSSDSARQSSAVEREREKVSGPRPCIQT